MLCFEQQHSQQKVFSAVNVLAFLYKMCICLSSRLRLNGKKAQSVKSVRWNAIF